MARDIVLLHGFTHTGASWEAVVAALGERYRALAPDIRGHGTRSEAEPVTLEAVLGDLAALAPERFTLVGYSMGGRIALHAAVALGARIERLVLIGASPGLAEAAERAARRAADEALADELSVLSIDQLAARWARTPVLAGQPPAVAAAVHADRLRNSPAGLARALRGLGTGVLPSLWDRLGEIAMPVAVVVGERDQKFSAIAERMAGALPRAEVVVVPGTGHAVHVEAPARVAALIRRRSLRRRGT
ncbi:MAG: 2-succinyl-6-hydroxy-2,4-cyclohexadiene-1-carboxylate synthase [Solirubrobacterales bacterium]|nr:2-succinyl-6-hydroxy-2,4-cyclohexadiene-1-carboxylate synthase [Solirubrobacterales bacterium]